MIMHIQSTILSFTIPLTIFFLVPYFFSEAADAGESCMESAQVVCDEATGEAEWRRWENVGPGGGGWFMHSAIGPDGSMLAAGDVGGASLSRDGGVTWKQLGSVNGITQTHVASVAFDDSDADTMYIGTEQGMYRSTDGGENFSHVVSDGRICKIAIGSTRSYISRASAWNQDCKEILTSTDNGATWSTAYTLPDNTHVMNIRINPLDSDVALFVSQAGRFFTYDDGALQTLHETSDGGSNLAEVAVGLPVFDAAWSTSGNVSYITTREYDGSNNPEGRLIRKDAGYDSTQTEITTARTGMIWVPAGTTDTIRLIDPRIWGEWMSGEGMYESTDGGQNFTKISSWTNHDRGWTDVTWATQTRGVKDWVFSAYDSDVAIYTTIQFVRGTTDSGRTFADLTTTEVASGEYRTTGINNTNGIVAKQHPLNNDFIMLGYYDLGCWRSLNGGDTWQNCNQSGFSGSWGESGGEVQAIVMDPDDENVVWIASTVADGYILKSTEKGEQGTWIDSGSGLPSSADRIDDLAIDPSSPTTSRHLFAIVDGDVYRSQNGGSDWSLVYACGDCYRVAIDSAVDTVLVGGNSGLYGSTANGDGGTWSAVTLADFTSAGTGNWDENNYEGVSDIVSDSSKAGVFWISAKGSTGGVFRYENGVVTRKKSHIYARAIDIDTTTGRVYLGTTRAIQSGGYNEDVDGLTVSSDDGDSWRVMDTPMPYPFVGYVYIPKSDTNTMWILNPGNGFWKVDTTPVFSNTSFELTDVNGDLLEPGDTLQNTVTITNAGNGRAEGVTILSEVDSEVENVEVISVVGCGSSYVDESTATTLNLTGLDLAVGVDCSITFETTVISSLSGDGTVLSEVDLIATQKGDDANFTSNSLAYSISSSPENGEEEEEDENGSGSSGSVGSSSGGSGGGGGSRSSVTPVTDVTEEDSSDAATAETETDTSSDVPSRESLLQQVRVLKIQLLELLQQRAAASVTSITTLRAPLDRNLTVGSEGEDVRRLQQFLNQNGFTVRTGTGAGAPGNESTFFGELTRAALARFQAANNITPAVGFFGPITRSAIENFR